MTLLTRLIGLAVLLALSMAAGAETRKIALTFDDAPRPDTPYMRGPERAAKLMASLRAAKVAQVAFFCNTARFEADGAARIASYAQAGHLIANHSHTHADLHRVGTQAFIADLKSADEGLRSFANFRRWFRFPYLREGKTVAERDEIRAELRKMGYLSAYVTVDNYDWHMDAMLQQAVGAGKRIAFDRLRDAYVDLQTQSVEFYDGVARKTLGRSPRHVLLLHENDLAALFIGDLVARLRREGWEIISPEEAFADPIAAVEPGTLRLGQGRVIAMAIEAGYQGPTRMWEDEEKLRAEFERRRVWE
jgi:peptidoglycan-N-acetylglucosamine deacetylase